MIKVDLKGSEKEFESGVSVAEVAKSIGMGLYKSACAAKVNGEVCDLRTVLNEDCKVEILTFDDKEGKKAYWHTASHIMAQAVNRLYPGTKFAIGPAVDNGFYYDMELPQAITNDAQRFIDRVLQKMDDMQQEFLTLRSRMDESINQLNNRFAQLDEDIVHARELVTNIRERLTQQEEEQGQPGKPPVQPLEQRSRLDMTR